MWEFVYITFFRSKEVSRRHRSSSITESFRGNYWFDKISIGADAGSCWFSLRGRAELVHVSLSSLHLHRIAAFIISGTHKNKGQAVRTYLFRFYTAMTIYLISVTLINSSAFIFPWLCKSRNSRFSTLHVSGEAHGKYKGYICKLR